MINLSWLLQKLFELHGTIPRFLWRDGRAFLPVHMMIEVTYRCNLRCNFCHYLDIIEGKAKPVGPSPGDLRSEDILRYIDDMPHGRLISFTGGETLVRRDFPQILAHAARDHRVHIITNGSLIRENVARSYIELAPRRIWGNGLVLVEVSLEGPEALHDRIVQRKGSWRRSVDGIRHLVRCRSESRKRFPKLDLKLVVTRETVSSLVDFMHLARELGVDLVNFLAEHELMKNADGQKQNLYRQQREPQGVDPTLLRQQLLRCYELEREWGLQIRLTPRVPIDEFVRHYTDDRALKSDEYACEGLWSRLGITGDGRYSGMCPYAAAGDVRQGALRELWNHEQFRSFRAATQRARIYPGCHGCCNLKYVGTKRHGLRGVDEGAKGVEIVPPRPRTSTPSWTPGS